MAKTEQKITTEQRVDMMDVIKSRIAMVTSQEVRVGLAGPEAKLDHVGRDGKSAGLTVEELAAIHEYGVGVPERSFIRSTANANHRSISRQYQEGLRAAIRGTGGSADGLHAIGRLLSAEMKRKLEHGRLPPLAASTLADPNRDPRGLPLVDTEQILGAIGWEVKRRG